MRLHGHDAIAYAEAHSLGLSKYTDPTEEARDGLTLAEARKVAAEDPALIYLDLLGQSRTYEILAVRFEPEHIEEHREYIATCISEALMMAERDDAGRADYTYGVLPEDYAEARKDGVEFNEADGLLV